MPTDKSNADMLYSIVKQLDLKYIDWKLVAAECKISNGHAARMRYHRFRQVMEKIQPSKRGPRGAKASAKNQKLKGGLSDNDDEEKCDIKAEEEENKLGIKDEPKDEPWSDDDAPLSKIPRVKEEAEDETMEDANREIENPEQKVDVETEALPTVASEVSVKAEPPVWSWN